MFFISIFSVSRSLLTSSEDTEKILEVLWKKRKLLERNDSDLEIECLDHSAFLFTNADTAFLKESTLYFEPDKKPSKLLSLWVLP